MADTMSTRSPFDLLAPELKLMILKRVCPTSLLALAMANKSLYALFKDNEHIITYNVVAETTGHHFPHAIALYAADHFSWGAMSRCCTDSEQLTKIQEFGRKFLERSTGSIPVKPHDFNYTVAMEMSNDHDAIQEHAAWFVMKEQTLESLSNKTLFESAFLTKLGMVESALYAQKISNKLVAGLGPSHFTLGQDSVFHYFLPSEVSLVYQVRLVMKILVKFGNNCQREANPSILLHMAVY